MDIIQPAFVLHRRPYRETSLLVTLFTPEHGKQNAVVKGVRGTGKAAMQKNATLQPFQTLQVVWRDRSQIGSDLVTLKQFESSGIYYPLHSDASVCGLYCNELLYRLLYPHLSANALFDVYQTTLKDLLKAENRLDQAWVLRQFEYQLLQELGVGLSLTEDAFGQAIQPERNYMFFPESGAYAKDQLSLDQQATATDISGHCLLALEEMAFCPDCMNEWKHLFRRVLAVYLGQKPIMSRQLFK